MLSADQRAQFERAAKVYIEVQRLNADRPEARVTLGAFLAQRSETAEAEYRAAIKLFVPAYVNFADLYRGSSPEKEGEALLREALERAPDNAEVVHALGLSLVRQHRLPEATAMLAKASELAPDRARYA